MIMFKQILSEDLLLGVMVDLEVDVLHGTLQLEVKTEIMRGLIISLPSLFIQ